MEGKIHVYCINLKHRTDRWKRFSEQSELQVLKQHYPFERFEGINGSAVDIQKDGRISLRTKRNIKEHTRRDHEELDSAGGVGCYLSHTGVWRKIVDRPEEFGLVLEDDAILDPGFTDALHRAMKEATLLPQFPDVWFFTSPMPCYYDSKQKPMPQNVKGGVLGPWITHTCGTFTGYLIRKEAAARLLENAFPLDMHVDHYTCLNGDLGRVFTAYHSNVEVRPYSLKEGDTDIQTVAECPICDIPTNYRRKGMMVISLPVVAVGLGLLAGMYMLSRRGGGGRR